MEEVKLTAQERKRRFLVALREKGPIEWAKLIAFIVPLLHLILTPIHVSALLKLEDQICGFVMFLSILGGLVVLFEATRVKDDEIGTKILLICFLIVDMLLIGWLLSIYRDALANQQTLRDPEVVSRAVTLSLAMMGCYAVSLLLALLSFGIHGRKAV